MGMDLEKLKNLFEKPPVYAPGDGSIWTDPYIAGQMLATHLNPDIDAASRKPEAIRKVIRFWLENKIVRPGDSLLDLGCGPGLYAEELAKAGVKVVGIDQSANSIVYAQKKAHQENLDIEYRCGNFLELDEVGKYDLAVQVYGEYNALSDTGRPVFLSQVYQALKSGGTLLMDVTTRKLRGKFGLKTNWYIDEAGFWRPDRHLVLEKGFDYPEQDIWLDQYVIIDEQGNSTVYRVWFKDFTLETLKAEVEAVGFRIDKVWGSLDGEPYDAEGDWIAVALRKT